MFKVTFATLMLRIKIAVGEPRYVTVSVHANGRRNHSSVW